MLLKAITACIDYCLFTLGFIIAVQLPEFIQQYKQYLVGKLSESDWHLAGYQKIADQMYKGDLSLLINDYLASGKSAISQTGELVANLVTRHNTLQENINGLNQSSYIEQVMHLIQTIDVDDAQVVLSYYQLAVPLTLQALVTGAILAFVLVWLRMLISWFLQHLFGLSFNRKSKVI
ncbi:DUF2937 family protein [Colwellia sp. MEBiC06753]